MAGLVANTPSEQIIRRDPGRGLRRLIGKRQKLGVALTAQCCQLLLERSLGDPKRLGQRRRRRLAIGIPEHAGLLVDGDQPIDETHRSHRRLNGRSGRGDLVPEGHRLDELLDRIRGFNHPPPAQVHLWHLIRIAKPLQEGFNPWRFRIGPKTIQGGHDGRLGREAQPALMQDRITERLHGLFKIVPSRRQQQRYIEGLLRSASRPADHLAQR